MNSKIVIDITKIRDPHCGLGQFSTHLNKELFKLNSELVFYAERNSQELINGHFLENKKWHRYKPSFWPKAAVWHAIHQDVKSYPVSKKVKKVLTIHDLNYLEEEHRADRKRSYIKKLEKKISEASALTFISNFTKNEVSKKFDISQKEYKVIYNGFCLDDSLPTRPLKLPEDIGEYIFSIGTVVPKKNFKLILEMAKLNKNLKFIIAGTLFHSHANELVERVKREGLADQVYFIGTVSEGEKNYLYQNAKAFLHPSYLEGFGLPVIEAMAHGTAVACSNRCSLPEVVGQYGSLFDPDSADDALGAIMLLNEKRESRELKSEDLKVYASQFSWSKAAKEYYDLYKSLL